MIYVTDSAQKTAEALARLVAQSQQARQVVLGLDTHGGIVLDTRGLAKPHILLKAAGELPPLESWEVLEGFFLERLQRAQQTGVEFGGGAEQLEGALTIEQAPTGEEIVMLPRSNDRPLSFSGVRLCTERAHGAGGRSRELTLFQSFGERPQIVAYSRLIQPGGHVTSTTHVSSSVDDALAAWDATPIGRKVRSTLGLPEAPKRVPASPDTIFTPLTASEISRSIAREYLRAPERLAFVAGLRRDGVLMFSRAGREPAPDILLMSGLRFGAAAVDLSKDLSPDHLAPLVEKLMVPRMRGAVEFGAAPELADHENERPAVTLPRDNQPPLRFSGELVSYAEEEPVPLSTFRKIAVYLTEGGRFVVQSTVVPTKGCEVSMRREAAAFDSLDEVLDYLNSCEALGEEVAATLRSRPIQGAAEEPLFTAADVQPARRRR